MTITPVAPSTIALKNTPSAHQAVSSNRIHQVAIRVLTELAAALVLTAICIPFLSSWGVVAEVFAISLTMPFVNLIIQIAAANIVDRNLKIILKNVCSTHFYHYGAMNAMTLIHETGHFCFARLLFQGKPQIKILPFAGGWTKWSSRSLTLLGGQLGYRQSVFLITIAGSVFALTVATISLVAGLLLRQLHPHASAYLIAAGVWPFLNDSHYALSALWSSPSDISHDFVRLQSLGIHPTAAAVTILAIPTLIGLGFNHSAELFFR